MDQAVSWKQHIAYGYEAKWWGKKQIIHIINSSLYSVIVPVRVVKKRTVIGSWAEFIFRLFN